MMARMVPSVVIENEFNGSYGEAELYKTLKNLPDDYVVFHSVRWNCKNRSGYMRWGESDYTVFDPNRGILTIEVKHGGIETDDTGHIVQINTKTHEKIFTNPMNQAERCKHAFIDIMEDGLPEDQIYWVEAAVWFTYIQRGTIQGELPPSYHEGNMLYKDDMLSPIEAIDKIFNFYKMEKLRYYDPRRKVAVIKLFSPTFNAIPSISVLYDEQEFYFNRMTQEQSCLLDYLEEQKIAVIQGGAGTGKTMIAIEKVRRLSKNENVLFLCFNRFLLDFLKEEFGDQMPNVEFNNLFTMASGVLQKEATKDDIIDYLNDFDKCGWKYKSIIIDEGQDFDEEQIRLLKSIAEIQEGCFYVFYDKNQLVQQRNSLSWARDIECRLVLSLNCRNTRSIAETSGIPIDVTNIRMRENVLGNKPNFYIVKTTDAVKDTVSSVIRKYTDNGFKQKQIVILTVKTLETSVLTGIDFVGSYHLINERNERGILFTTARKFKGLESDIIIFVDVDEDIYRNPETRRVFYVGASRAKHYLDFVSLLSDHQEKILAERVSERSKKNVRLAIMAGLKVKVMAQKL